MLYILVEFSTLSSLFLQIFGLEHRVRGAELTGRATPNNGEHKDYKEKVLERRDVVASTYSCEAHMDQELQSDLCCCDGECGKHVLVCRPTERLAAGRDSALLTATEVIFITERMKEIWKKLGS